jgi:hypothetical protein
LKDPERPWKSSNLSPKPVQRSPCLSVGFAPSSPPSVGAFAVKNGKIVEIDFLADLERIAQLDLTLLCA